ALWRLAAAPPAGVGDLARPRRGTDGAGGGVADPGWGGAGTPGTARAVGDRAGAGNDRLGPVGGALLREPGAGAGEPGWDWPARVPGVASAAAARGAAAALRVARQWRALGSRLGRRGRAAAAAAR